jgi:hypothetical protein
VTSASGPHCGGPASGAAPLHAAGGAPRPTGPGLTMTSRSQAGRRLTVDRRPNGPAQNSPARARAPRAAGPLWALARHGQRRTSPGPGRSDRDSEAGLRPVPVESSPTPGTPAWRRRGAAAAAPGPARWRRAGPARHVCRTVRSAPARPGGASASAAVGRRRATSSTDAVPHCRRD